MTVLVTGATGFLGSHVAEQLSREGRPVRALVRRSSDTKFLSSLPHVELAYGSPIDRQAQRIAESLGLPLHLGALGEAERLGLRIVEGGQVDVGLAIGGSKIPLRDQAEASGSVKHDVEPAVVQFLRADDLADASGVEQRRRLAFARRLDHSDSASPRERVANHIAIARLENMKRQLGAGKQDCPSQRE